MVVGIQVLQVAAVWVFPFTQLAQSQTILADRQETSESRKTRTVFKTKYTIYIDYK